MQRNNMQGTLGFLDPEVYRRQLQSISSFCVGEALHGMLVVAQHPQAALALDQLKKHGAIVLNCEPNGHVSSTIQQYLDSIGSVKKGDIFAVTNADALVSGPEGAKNAGLLKQFVDIVEGTLAKIVIVASQDDCFAISRDLMSRIKSFNCAVFG